MRHWVPRHFSAARHWQPRHFAGSGVVAAAPQGSWGPFNRDALDRARTAASQRATDEEDEAALLVLLLALTR